MKLYFCLIAVMLFGSVMLLLSKKGSFFEKMGIIFCFAGLAGMLLLYWMFFFGEGD